VNCGVVGEAILYKTGDRLLAANVNHYITDGDVAVANLIDRSPLTG
jgi:hypothetical protein